MRRKKRKEMQKMKEINKEQTNENKEKDSRRDGLKVNITLWNIS